MLAEGAVEAFVLLEAVLQARQVGREHVRATRTLRQKLTNHFISCVGWIISGGLQPRKKHHPKLQKLIFQKCVQKFQNVILDLS